LPPAPLALNPIEPMLEYDQSDHPFRRALIYDALPIQNGMVQIPDRPGLGIEINRDILKQYSQPH